MVVNVFENTQPGQICHGGIELSNVRVGCGLNSHHHLRSIFLKDLRVAHILLSLRSSLLISKISDRVHKLASQPIRTIHMGVVLLAESGLILRRHVLLLLELALAVCEGTIVAELALLVELPVSAHLGLVLLLEGVGTGGVGGGGGLRLVL